MEIMQKWFLDCDGNKLSFHIDRLAEALIR